MKSVKRAPNYTLFEEVTADQALADATKGDALVCNGYEYLHLQVIPADGAAVTLDVGFWNDTEEKAMVASPELQFVGTANTPYEASIPVRGRKVVLGIGLGGAGSAKVYAAAFNYVNPD